MVLARLGNLQGIYPGPQGLLESITCCQHNTVNFFANVHLFYWCKLNEVHKVFLSVWVVPYVYEETPVPVL